MKTIAATLSVFLGASLLLNAVLASRLSEPERPDDPPAPAAPAAVAPALDRQLEKERREKEELRVRLAALQKSSSEPPTAVAPPASAVASQREKLRAFIRKALQSKKTQNNAPMDPEELAEMSSFLMAYYPALLSPSSDPAKFAEFLAGTLEITAEETGFPLSADQKRRFDDLTRALVEELSAAPQGSAVGRRLGELEAQKRYVAGLSELWTPAQEEKLRENNMMQMDGFGQSRSFSGVNDEALAKSVLDDWTKLLSLDDAQRILADASAQRFVQDLRQLAPPQGADASTAVRSLEYRIEVLKAQQRALDALSGSLTDAQRRQLLKKGVWEYRLFPSPPAQK